MKALVQEVRRAVHSNMFLFIGHSAYSFGASTLELKIFDIPDIFTFYIVIKIILILSLIFNISPSPTKVGYWTKTRRVLTDPGGGHGLSCSVEVELGHNCITTDHSTEGVYPLATPLLKVVREEKLACRFPAAKGAIHDLVSPSCISAKNGTRAGCCEPARTIPKSQLSNLEGLGHGGGLQSSPTLMAAWESIANISRSVSGIATCSDWHLVTGRSAKGYCWYAPCRGPSTFHWQLKWLQRVRWTRSVLFSQ